MLKAADHVLDRAEERTSIRPREIAALRAKVQKMDLPDGAVFHYEFPQRGYAVIAPARDDYPKHVVKTILAPWMHPPGTKLEMQKAATIDPQVLSFFSSEMGKAAAGQLSYTSFGQDPKEVIEGIQAARDMFQRKADGAASPLMRRVFQSQADRCQRDMDEVSRTMHKQASSGKAHLAGGVIGAGLGAGGSFLSQTKERRDDRLFRDLGHMSPAMAEHRKKGRRFGVLAGAAAGAGLGVAAPFAGAAAEEGAKKVLTRLGHHATAVAEPTIKKVEESAKNLVQGARTEARELLREQGDATVRALHEHSEDIANKAGKGLTRGMLNPRNWFARR